MRRGVPILVALAVGLVLGSYVVYTQRVVAELRNEALREGRMYAQVYQALSDTSTSDATGRLLELSRHISESGVPVILSDVDGRPTASANLPFDAQPGDPRVREWIARLDAENDPVTVPGIGTVHIGNTRLVKGLRVIPAVQAATLALFLIAGIYAFRTRASAERERVWAGMARESAHQLGTPLSSLGGWIELLREGDGDPMTARALDHMQSDLTRLERVAHRFERIGRPPRQDDVDLADLVDRIAVYFRARVPTLAHTVAIAVRIDERPLNVAGDAVLLEWALEAIVKNAIDALAGRGGRILITATRLPEGAVRIRLADDGPGVSREARKRIFDAGFTTKQHGWGIGLALSRRIVEESHRGTLTLVPTDRGATFDINFPA